MLTSELIHKIKQIEISTRHMVAENIAGQYHSVFKGQGMEFDEVRPYYAGDDVRRIDWNVTARTGTPYIRRYVEEQEATVMLVLDSSGSSDFGSDKRFKRELAAELTAVLSYAATTNNDKVGLLIFTDQIELLVPPRKGRRHVLRLIREVLAYKPRSRGTDIKLALDTINRFLKRRSIVFLISDFLINVENYKRSLSITNKRHDVVAIDLQDPMESKISNVGLIVMEDSETGAIKYVDTADSAWQDEYANQVRRFESDKKNVMAHSGVDRIKVSTNKDYLAGLLNFFKIRAKRLRR